jgi:predicted  nucleic acid-binding Zn-ribbon protein
VLNGYKAQIRRLESEKEKLGTELVATKETCSRLEKDLKTKQKDFDTMRDQYNG